MCLDDFPIKYFTAELSKKLTRNSSAYPNQINYYAAVCAHLGPRISFIYGTYSTAKARAHLVEKGVPLGESPLQDVWKVEEKQTDVSLALEAYSDAIRSEVDQVVLVTNDTDHVPTASKIKKDTNAIVGVISPNRNRYMNKDLAECADWSVGGLSDDLLTKSQLPPFIRGRNKNHHKPVQWYPRPDLLEPIFEEAKKDCRSVGGAWKWLHDPSAHVGNRKPIDLVETEEGAEQVRAYQEEWALRDSS